MKGTRTGIFTVVFFLLGIPVIADTITGFAAPDAEIPVFGLTRFLVKSYVIVLPFYFLYLLLKKWCRWMVQQLEAII